jgi:ATP-dependent Clp protease protease subunit
MASRVGVGSRSSLAVPDGIYIERDIFGSRYHRSDTGDRTGWRSEDDTVTQTLIPTVIEEGSRGERAFDIYSLLLRERIVFLGQEVDDQIANLIISQMLFLEAQDPEKDISLYINSPGGMAYAGMAIYDAIQHVRPEVSTICVGMAMSAAAMILCAGTPGKRLALPNARIMIHQGTAGTRGAPSDMAIQLREVLAMTERMAEIIAHHSGRPTEQVQRDIDRDYFMSADEAVAYGLIDDIIPPRRGLLAPALEAVASAS